jgi:sorting nexin-1/2
MTFLTNARYFSTLLFGKVSDPVQHSDGLNKYTAYRVDVRPPAVGADASMGGSIIINAAPNQQQQYSAVLRRYSDFLWLYERLHTERPGAIVPPLPEKQPVGRFSPQFVEERRVHLERFLRRVAVHPELQDTASLDLFLRADDMAFNAAKNAKTSGIVMNASMMQQSQYGGGLNLGMGGMGNTLMQPSTTKKAEGIKRWFAETKTSMTGDLVKSPDDDIFDEINRYITGLDNQMKNISQQASGLVRKGKEIANGLFEFGLAFNLLGQSEADALGSALSSMGETADQLSVLSAEHAEREMAQFEEPLQDYIKMIHAAKLAVQRRSEKRLSYSTCLSEVESKVTQLNKLRMQIGSEGKAYSMEMSLRRAQEASDIARDEFADCSQRVLREVDRFKREKAEDMRRTVLDYIKLQVDYNKRMEQVWSTLVPKLEEVQTLANNNTTTSTASGGVASGIPDMKIGVPPPQPVAVSLNQEAYSGTNARQQQQSGPYDQQQSQYIQHDQGGSTMYSGPPGGGAMAFHSASSGPPGAMDPMMSIQYRDPPQGL